MGVRFNRGNISICLNPFLAEGGSVRENTETRTAC